MTGADSEACSFESLLLSHTMQRQSDSTDRLAKRVPTRREHRSNRERSRSNSRSKNTLAKGRIEDRQRSSSNDRDRHHRARPKAKQNQRSHSRGRSTSPGIGKRKFSTTHKSRRETSGSPRRHAGSDKASVPRVTMEDENSSLQQRLGTVDMSSIVGPYAPLKAWHEGPVLPSASHLRMELDNAFPIGIFLSLQKAQRTGTKQSYFRSKPMPAFYQNRSYVPSHWGQRKLLLSEVMFLTFALDSQYDDMLLVYAGAAHGGHILHLLDLFPNIFFDCYDPSPFNPKLVAYSETMGARVRLFTDRNGWFDEKVAAKYSPGGEHFEYHKLGGRRKLLFVSDIRNIKETEKPQDKLATMAKSAVFMAKAKDEMKMQSDWVKAMRAEMSMLKFKLQYPAEGGPAYEQYLRGDVYFQCWAPTPSSETRLITYKAQLDDDGGDTVWNLPLYTGKVDYFNAALRTTDFSHVSLWDTGILGPALRPPPDFFRSMSFSSSLSSSASSSTVFNSSSSSPSSSSSSSRSSSSSSSSSSPPPPPPSRASSSNVPSEERKSYTLKHIWQGFGLPLTTVDAFLETLIWSNYIRYLEKVPVTVEGLRAKISSTSAMLSGQDSDLAFSRHLNFQKPGENASEYGAPVSAQMLHGISEYVKTQTPLTSYQAPL